MGDRGDGAHGQWGTWAMGHMGNEQWGPWAIGTFLPITPLILDGFLQKFNWTDINVFYLNTGRFFHDALN